MLFLQRRGTPRVATVAASMLAMGATASSLAWVDCALAQEPDPETETRDFSHARIVHTIDVDNDGINDVVVYDTDGDGKGDYVEGDTDGDGAPDMSSTDARYIGNIDAEFDPGKIDSDRDGVVDADEREAGTDVFGSGDVEDSQYPEPSSEWPATEPADEPPEPEAPPEDGTG